MIDLAKRDGLEIDPARRSELLVVAGIPTVAVRRRGLDALADALDTALAAPPPEPAGLSEASTVAAADAHDPANLRALQREARARASTEERRVGKTCGRTGRSRWSLYNAKQKRQQL